jgi:hypothetical protein
LEGFNIPGIGEKLITTLFADDTTVFLSEFDKFKDLELILGKWCIASGARFNVDKTEVTPVGSENYRNSVITTRCLHSSQEPLATNIHIANDKEPVRTLGAWIGNNIDQASVWSTTLDKIRAALAQWDKSHPTLFGRRLIIQMIVGGMTQYLTKVQGMPKYAEQALEKIIQNFIWNGKKTHSKFENFMSAHPEGWSQITELKS